MKLGKMSGTGLICPKCGFKNLIGEKYCSECGCYLLLRPKQSFDNKPAEKDKIIVCSTCQTESSDDKKFCSQCGTNLRPETSQISRGALTDIHIGTSDISEDTSPPKDFSSTRLLKPNTMLQNRYKINKLIGQGGMGAIYLADDTRFANRVCVLKEMLDHFNDEEQRKTATANFLREADMLSSMHHDGIPEVYDRFSEGNRHYLVMEYIQGIDLEQKIAQDSDPFDEKMVLGWATQICDILSYLHNQKPPVVYRDMKPANLILTKKGKIYMVDFGIARFFNPIKKGTMVGTQGYAPPEQYRGLMEPRSDIYALGATMHHLLTGRDPQEEPPFSFPKIREVNPKLSVATEKLIDKCLSRDPADRYETAEDMLKSIMKISTGFLENTKVCPHCNNRVNATKQFCPYCNEYISSSVSNDDVRKKSFVESFLDKKFLIAINIFSLVVIIVLLILILSK